jgi:hypothetical protein
MYWRERRVRPRRDNHANTFITGRTQRELDAKPELIEHEKRHATQWTILGPGLFVASYYVNEFVGGGPCNNVFERDAGLNKGGYEHC